MLSELMDPVCYTYKVRKAKHLSRAPSWDFRSKKNQQPVAINNGKQLQPTALRWGQMHHLRGTGAGVSISNGANHPVQRLISTLSSWNTQHWQGECFIPPTITRGSLNHSALPDTSRRFTLYVCVDLSVLPSFSLTNDNVPGERNSLKI